MKRARGGVRRSRYIRLVVSTATPLEMEMTELEVKDKHVYTFQEHLEA
jgi:hypothetical protein